MTVRLKLGRQKKVKRKQDFKVVFDAGRRYSNAFISLVFTSQQITENKDPVRRIGIIASRKVGNAVQRNRLKRLVREVFRINQHSFRIPLDLIVILKPLAREATGESLQNGFLELCKKAHLI